jgi:hypothetical protein
LPNVTFFAGKYLIAAIVLIRHPALVIPSQVRTDASDVSLIIRSAPLVVVVVVVVNWSSGRGERHGDAGGRHQHVSPLVSVGEDGRRGDGSAENAHFST